MTTDTVCLPGPPDIRVHLRRSSRARRCTLRVSRVDGTATLTIPRGGCRHTAEAFLRKKEGWLRAQLARIDGPRPVCLGETLPLRGRDLLLVPSPDRSVRIDGDRLLVPGPAETVAARVKGYLRTLARDALVEASTRHAAALGRPFTRVTLRDTRSRWGSCSSRGELMYSWRLIMAPDDVLDYVAAHEVAHLAEMNHSPTFWATVRQLMPGYEAPKAWLRAHGDSLQRVSFDS
mgnify:CR=1 FL=1